MFYTGDVHKCQHFLYIRLVWRYLYPRHHIKTQRFSPAVHFLMPFFFILFISGTHQGSSRRRCAKSVSTSFLSELTNRTIYFTKMYEDKEREKERSVPLTLHQCKDAPVCRSVTVSRIFTKMLIRSQCFFFIFEKLSCFAFLYSINIFSRFN